MATFQENLRAAIGEFLVGIEDLLGPHYKLTLVARHTSNPKAHIVQTNEETTARAVEAIRDLESQADAAVVEARP